MSVSVGIRVFVKFRFLGLTLGTLDRSLTASIGAGGAVAFTVVSGPPALGVTTLINERGVLLQAWA
ncbi:MAG: hypothetical protein ACYC96_13545 [Fimbriimonadaceae bacterium]